MASATPEDVTLDTEIECPVCLQTCIHPVRLPCSHIFCFLCIKGVANQSKRCAMCRQEIPADFLENPDLLERPKEPAKEEEGEYHWFYEGRGRNGWWRFDERTNADIEEAYRNHSLYIRLPIADRLYDIDLVGFTQCRVDMPHLTRRIKWDRIQSAAKGTAGILNRQLLKPGTSAQATTAGPSSASTSSLVNIPNATANRPKPSRKKKKGKISTNSPVNGANAFGNPSTRRLNPSINIATASINILPNASKRTRKKKNGRNPVNTGMCAPGNPSTSTTNTLIDLLTSTYNTPGNILSATSNTATISPQTLTNPVVNVESIPLHSLTNTPYTSQNSSIHLPCPSTNTQNTSSRTKPLIPYTLVSPLNRSANLIPSTSTDLIPSTSVSLIPSTSTNLIPSTSSSLIPITSANLVSNTSENLIANTTGNTSTSMPNTSEIGTKATRRKRPTRRGRKRKLKCCDDC